MNVSLYPHQEKALLEIHNGSILKGGVGSGKSRTAIAYYYKKEKPRKLYIITTARKRDTHDWDEELAVFEDVRSIVEKPIDYVVDSWNNIHKYVDVKNAFFIFDEQRAVGYGTWSKSLIKITSSNRWILLSATPGDVWMDYMPVFVANNFYKNKTDFVRKHAVFSRYSKYPVIERYVDQGQLNKYKKLITVDMKYEKKVIHYHKEIFTPFDDNKFFLAKEKRWNVFENKPIKDVAELYRVMRRIVNEDPRRLLMVKEIVEQTPKIIIFYNFNYELDLLREMCGNLSSKATCAEWNGHKHELIPKTDKWIYLVQYTAGAEGWNCIETNQVLFYSQNYSYKIMKQAEGRIDRINTPFNDLYYYHIKSKSFIDLAIGRSLNNKKNFQEAKL